MSIASSFLLVGAIGGTLALGGFFFRAQSKTRKVRVLVELALTAVLIAVVLQVLPPPTSGLRLAGWTASLVIGLICAVINQIPKWVFTTEPGDELLEIMADVPLVPAVMALIFSTAAWLLAFMALSQVLPQYINFMAKADGCGVVAFILALVTWVTVLIGYFTGDLYSPYFQDE